MPWEKIERVTAKADVLFVSHIMEPLLRLYAARAGFRAFFR